MTSLDDRIRAGLDDFPAAQPRSLDDIQERALTVQKRRRAATTGIVLVAGAAVTFPFAATGSGPSNADHPAPPASTASAEDTFERAPDAEETVACESWSGEIRGGGALALDEVPDHMRLLWDTTLAEPPTSAWAVDWSAAVETVTNQQPEDCVVPDEDETGLDALALVQTDDSIVTNYITIYGPHEIAADHFQQVEHRTVATRVGPMHIVADRDRAYWPAGDGQHWAASYSRAMTDRELVELVESVQLQGERIDVSEWSGYDSVKSASPFESYELRGIEVSMDGPINVKLESDRNRHDLWRGSRVDDEVVDINGQPGILTPTSGRLDFLTDEGVLVLIGSHGRTTHELLAVARSIEPVPADDPRLAAVWQTEFDQQTE